MVSYAYSITLPNTFRPRFRLQPRMSHLQRKEAKRCADGFDVGCSYVALSCRVFVCCLSRFLPLANQTALLFTDSCHDRCLLPTAQIKSTNSKPLKVCSWWDGGYNMIKVRTVCLLWLLPFSSFTPSLTTFLFCPQQVNCTFFLLLSSFCYWYCRRCCRCRLVVVPRWQSVGVLRDGFALSFAEKQWSKIHKQPVLCTRENQQVF